MTASDSLERRIADHYATEATPRAPDWLLASALETIDDTPQRRVLMRMPWRFPHMNNFAKVAIAAVVVIAVGAVGLSLLGLRPNPGWADSPSPALPLPVPRRPARPRAARPCRLRH